MGKIIVSAWTTLDGFVAGPDDELDWLLPDDQMMRYEQQLVDNADALLLGRITHSDFAGAWPAVAADPSEPPANRAYAQRVCALTRYVVSARGEVAPWEGTIRLDRLDRDTVGQLKADHSGAVVVYGSLRVVETLVQLGAVDELHLLTHPIFLGRGRPLYPGRLDLEHLASDTFGSGVVCNRYIPGTVVATG